MKSHQGAQRGPKTWSVREGSGSPMLSVLPLRGAVSKALGDELIRNGCGDHCGECEKPFTAVRKARGIGRVTHLDPASGLYCSAWLLCGACTAAMRANGNKVSHKLLVEAREAAKAGMVMMMPAGGAA